MASLSYTVLADYQGRGQTWHYVEPAPFHAMTYKRRPLLNIITVFYLSCLYHVSGVCLCHEVYKEFM